MTSSRAERYPSDVRCAATYTTFRGFLARCTLDAGHVTSHASDDGANAYVWIDQDHASSWPVRWLSDLDKPGQSYVRPLVE